MGLYMFEGTFEIQILTRLKVLCRSNIRLLEICRDLDSLCNGFRSHGIREKEDLDGQPQNSINDSQDQ